MNRKLLGFTLSPNGVRLKVADKATEKLKDRVRELTRRTRGTPFGSVVAELRETLLGWKAYFGITEVLSVCSTSTSGSDASYAAISGNNGVERAIVEL